MNSKFERLFNKIISESVAPEGSEAYIDKYTDEQRQAVINKAQECGFKFDDTKIDLLCAEIYENYGFDPLHVKNMPHDKFTGIVKQMLKNWYDKEDEVDPIPEIEQSKKVSKKKKVIKESKKLKKVSKKKIIKEHSDWGQIRGNHIIKEDEDWDDQDEDYETPTITIGELRKELSNCDPEEEIGLSWNTYSDGGDMCGGCYYDEDSNAFYFEQYTPGEEGYEYDEEEDLDENGDWKNGPPAAAPTVKEVLDEIKDLPDDVKVFGSWEANEGARYCIANIYGSHLELDGGTEC